MNTQIGSRHEGALTEWLLRAFGLLVYGLTVSNLARGWWLDQSRWTLLLLLIIEGYTLALVLVARPALARDTSPLVVIGAGYAAFYFVLLDAAHTTHLIPETAGVILLATGMICQFSAKFALGRCFGILPARRGIVISGPYRLVRHPIYAGYLIGHIGFLLSNFSWRNAAVFAVLYLVQILRIQKEEALLSESSAYRGYAGQVRWKLIPFVF